MTFFDFKPLMKKNSSIKITRELWSTPHYYIYWSPLKKVFYEHFANIDREWASDTFIEDLQSNDWKTI